MKKLFTLFAVIALLAGCSDDYDDSALTGRVDDLENRIKKLEEFCKQMNTNISSLQTIVTALQNNDYITEVIPVMQDGKEIGYTITFSKSNPITIYLVRTELTVKTARTDIHLLSESSNTPMASTTGRWTANGCLTIRTTR